MEFKLYLSYLGEIGDDGGDGGGGDGDGGGGGGGANMCSCYFLRFLHVCEHGGFLSCSKVVLDSLVLTKFSPIKIHLG